MPVRAEVVLDGEQRETLERWARRPKSSQALAFRCRIVLAAAEGRSSSEIADQILDSLAAYCQRINDSGH